MYSTQQSSKTGQVSYCAQLCLCINWSEVCVLNYICTACMDVCFWGETPRCVAFGAVVSSTVAVNQKRLFWLKLCINKSILTPSCIAALLCYLATLASTNTCKPPFLLWSTLECELHISTVCLVTVMANPSALYFKPLNLLASDKASNYLTSTRTGLSGSYSIISLYLQQHTSNKVLCFKAHCCFWSECHVRWLCAIQTLNSLFLSLSLICLCQRSPALFLLSPYLSQSIFVFPPFSSFVWLKASLPSQPLHLCSPPLSRVFVAPPLSISLWH